MLLCPHCQGTVAPLPVLSALSVIDFFQCDCCGKISERPKDARGQPTRVLVGLGERHAPTFASCLLIPHP